MGELVKTNYSLVGIKNSIPNTGMGKILKSYIKGFADRGIQGDINWVDENTLQFVGTPEQTAKLTKHLTYILPVEFATLFGYPVV